MDSNQGGGGGGGKFFAGGAVQHRCYHCCRKFAIVTGNEAFGPAPVQRGEEGSARVDIVSP